MRICLAYILVFLLIQESVCRDKLHTDPIDKILILSVTDINTQFNKQKYIQFERSLKSQQAFEDFEIEFETFALGDKFSSHNGAWSIYPVFNEIKNLYSGEFVYYMFCDSDSRINLKQLHTLVLKNINNSMPIFMGHALYDEEATIIHHFAFHENTKTFAYPDLAACLLMNLNMIQTASENLNYKNNFVIDAKYELAKQIWDFSSGKIELINNELFCNHKKSIDACVTWYNWSEPNCQDTKELVDNENCFFAVKTFSGFHSERIPIILETWYARTNRQNILFFSDSEDKSVPTVNSGPNTATGHCAKLFSILKYFMNNLSSNYEYLIVCDDDTLFKYMILVAIYFDFKRHAVLFNNYHDYFFKSVDRLFNLISCYKDENSFIIGERYGYMVHVRNHVGYNYATGGAGFVLSRKLIEKILFNCECPAPSTPDDMYVGLCIQNLDNVSFIHTDLLHQARPYDYPSEYLAHQFPISFHKYWNIENPKIDVYEKWLLQNIQNKNYVIYEKKEEYQTYSFMKHNDEL